jgi:hypothetical protein
MICAASVGGTALPAAWMLRRYPDGIAHVGGKVCSSACSAGVQQRTVLP